MSFDEYYHERLDGDEPCPTQDDWADLRSMDFLDPGTDGFPDFFSFDEPGDVLEGEIQSFRWGEVNPDGSEPYNELFVAIREPSGELWTYGFNRSYLIKRWKAIDPHPGDLIRVTYEGEDDDTGAHIYSVDIKRMRFYDDEWSSADEYLQGRDLFAEVEPSDDDSDEGEGYGTNIDHDDLDPDNNNPELPF